MKLAQPTVYYPNKGILYLATSPSLELRNELKYGETSQAPEHREKQHPGQLSTEESTIFFTLATNDRISAEKLARAMFEQRGLHLPTLKELIRRDVEQAKEVLRLAVAKAHVKSMPLLVAIPVAQVAARYREPAWSFLLEQRLHMGSECKSLGEWMAVSLKSPRVAGQLKAKGIVCVNWDPREPDFQAQFLPSELSLALTSAGYSHDDLDQDGQGVPTLTLSLTPAAVTARLKQPLKLAGPHRSAKMPLMQQNNVVSLGEARQRAEFEMLLAQPDPDRLFDIPFDDMAQYIDCANESLGDPVVLGLRALLALKKLFSHFGILEMPKTIGELNGALHYCKFLQLQSWTWNFPPAEVKRHHEVVVELAQTYYPELVESLQAFIAKDSVVLERIARERLPLQEMAAHYHIELGWLCTESRRRRDAGLSLD